jgi:hypothetical protein
MLSIFKLADVQLNFTSKKNKIRKRYSKNLKFNNFSANEEVHYTKAHNTQICTNVQICTDLLKGFLKL